MTKRFVNFPIQAFLLPFLLLISSLFKFYKDVSVIASPAQLIRPTVALTLLLALTISLLHRIFQDQETTGLIASFFVVLLCWAPESFQKTGALILYLCLASLALRFVWSHKFDLKWTMSFLTFVSFCLVAIRTQSLVTVIANTPKSYWSHLSFRASAPAMQMVASPVLPDIYYIVVDGYPRSDVLAELFNYDNSLFLDHLDTRGFIVLSENRSNYSRTVLSVASTLNMDYISSFLPGTENSSSWWLLEPFIDQSRARLALGELGYRSYAVMSDWGLTDNTTADEYFQVAPIHLSDLENEIVRKTPLGQVLLFFPDFVFVQSNQSHFKVVNLQFDALESFASMPGPKFVFVHIISPHPPFVARADGSFQSPPYPFTFNDADDFLLDDLAYVNGFREQVAFVNDRLARVVDEILANSTNDPIILLQADHGSGLLTNFSSPDQTCLRERFSPFAAYHLPGVTAEMLPPHLTPVNLFRFVFNHYFAAGLPLLEDRQYTYQIMDQIFREVDVTSSADSCLR